MKYCSNCAGDFSGKFHIYTQVYTENVELCSPKCLHQIKVKWTPKRKHSLIVKFLTFMIGIF